MANKFKVGDKVRILVEDGDLRYSFLPHIRHETVIYD